MEQDQKQRKLTGSPIGRFVERSARRFAGFLTKQSERFTPKEKKIVLLLFGILAGAASLMLVVPSTPTNIGHAPGHWVASGKAHAPVVELSQDSVIPNTWPGYPAALRALDSLYALDPRRFLEMVAKHLTRRDSLGIGR
jgi:hypothetical protein